MRIIQLIYSLCSGGAERFVVSLSNQLAIMGHDVTLCILRSRYDESNIFNLQFLTDQVKFHSFELEPGFSKRKASLVQEFIIAKNPDVVHCHLNVIPYIYRISLNHKSIRFVHTLHNVAEQTCSSFMQKYINRFFYKKGYILPITISAVCDTSYRLYYRLNNSICIYNGCELPIKTASFQKVCNEIKCLKESNDTLVFIHIARFHKQKNQKLLIDAFNELTKINRKFILVVIGKGFDEGNGKELASTACDRIHFIGLKNNVSDYLYCSDAFCLTSDYEGLPISLLEAMACGVVPICTSVGGIPDVIDDGISGLLSKKVSLESYIYTINRFIDSPDSITRSSIVERFNREYSIFSCAQKYIEIYKFGK